MNEQLRPHPQPAATQAAEGLPRRRFTVAEIRGMVAHGIVSEDERFELIGGEVVPKSPRGNRHELVKRALQQQWFPLIARTPIDLITETTLVVGDDEFLEPDFLFWPRSVPLKDVTAETALLIVEVADSSLQYDLGRKAQIYARRGLAELWVINANTLATTIHREPGQADYALRWETIASEPLIPLQAPHLAVTLGALGIV